MAKKPKEEATYTDIFAKTICELAQTHEKLITITAAMMDGCGLKGFAKRFPDRFFDVGIAEEHAVTFACGLAAGGFHPFFTVDRSGIVGNDGETHQGVFDLSYLTMIPNMTVFAPKNRYEFQDAIAFAADFEAPMAIRYPKTDAVRVLKEYREPIKLGKSEWIRRGSRVALLAIGTMVETAMEVEELLAKDGIDATVVNLRFAKPLDYEMLDEVLDYHSLIVTMEENVLSGGVGEHICRYVELHSTGVRVIACGIPDKFIHQGSIKELLEETGLDAQSIYQKISTML